LIQHLQESSSITEKYTSALSTTKSTPQKPTIEQLENIMEYLAWLILRRIKATRRSAYLSGIALAKTEAGSFVALAKRGGEGGRKSKRVVQRVRMFKLHTRCL